MSQYNFFTIKSCILKWYENLDLNVNKNESSCISKNNEDCLVIDFDFKNCIAQLCVDSPDWAPYQFVFFEAIDSGTCSKCEIRNPFYFFYDTPEMETVDVIKGLNEAVKLCSIYKCKK